jgi:hypothetical protein
MAKAPPLGAGIQPAGTHARRKSAQASSVRVRNRGWRGISFIF